MASRPYSIAMALHIGSSFWWAANSVRRSSDAGRESVATDMQAAASSCSM